VAELADALGSGSSEGNLLGVQIPPSAPCNLPRIDLVIDLAEQAVLNPFKSLRHFPRHTFNVTLQCAGLFCGLRRRKTGGTLGGFSGKEGLLFLQLSLCRLKLFLAQTVDLLDGLLAVSSLPISAELF
jgi:hypothetical protein